MVEEDNPGEEEVDEDPQEEEVQPEELAYSACLVDINPYSPLAPLGPPSPKRAALPSLGFSPQEGTPYPEWVEYPMKAASRSSPLLPRILALPSRSLYGTSAQCMFRS